MMRDPFDDLRVRDLAFFERLATLGSLGATARELHLPKATASRWLANLEAHVGQSLVKRTTRSVALTPAGLAFVDRVRDVLRSVQAARQGLDQGASGGLLRISVPVPMGRMLVGPVVARFREQFPGVRLEVKLETAAVDLVRDRFDLLLRGGPLSDSGLKARKLSAAKVWVYASARFRKQAPHTIPLLLAPGDEALLRRTKAMAGVQPAVRIDDRSAIADALTWGAGVGLLPTFLGEPGRERGELVRFFDEPVAVLPIHGLYHPSQRNDVRLQALMDAFAAQLDRVM
ncbi:MAG: LysR family transcriptional regulator [Myxococcaceae bacterium]